jgi:Trk K+ transport system NAD-binding subunit
MRSSAWDNSSEHTNQLQEHLDPRGMHRHDRGTKHTRLPIDEADFAVVSIGEDIGASLSTVALIKRHYPDVKIIARGISYIHTAILETMNVYEIINPEASYANQLAERFSMKAVCWHSRSTIPMKSLKWTRRNLLSAKN